MQAPAPPPLSRTTTTAPPPSYFLICAVVYLSHFTTERREGMVETLSLPCVSLFSHEFVPVFVLLSVLLSLGMSVRPYVCISVRSCVPSYACCLCVRSSFFFRFYPSVLFLFCVSIRLSVRVLAPPSLLVSDRPSDCPSIHPSHYTVPKDQRTNSKETFNYIFLS